MPFTNWQTVSRPADGQDQLEVERRRSTETLGDRTQGSKFKEETKMKQNENSKLSKGLCRAAVAIVAIGIAAAPAVHAKPNSKKTAGKAASVVAHVEVYGGPVTRMLLVKKDSKQYLLLGLDSSSGVALLDVSDPGQPRTIATTAGVAGAPATELKVVADTLTVFGTSEAETAATFDPKEIRSLSGVTAFIKDKAHGLIYVTNGDGLWIVKTKQGADAAAAPDYDGGGG
jgi:hypothetical protein